MNRISIHGLTKRYGNFSAVSDLSLDIPQASAFGLLGPNGAGKTTTFKCLLGLARADNGSVLFNGSALEPRMFERMAYVPEKSVLYEWMTGAQHLEMQRRSFRAYNASRASELMKLFDLNPKKRVRSLSKGMRTALALVMAFAIEPDLLILDEPTSGLDPVNQRSVLKLIIDASAQGSTVLFSSHQIGQVERAAENIAILQSGRLLLSGNVDELKTRQKIVEAIFNSDQFTVNGFASDARVQRVEKTGRILRLAVNSGSEEIVRSLQSSGAANVRAVDLNLEDIFLSAVDPHTQSGEIVEHA
ncbi:MAG: ABC transporter ATP-binding protein [Candidatus Eremiobacteraeota bacterium]|nr:ABC transporter ATP-binding protein [Candidatus Eremiobacteraeota bacterium]